MYELTVGLNHIRTKLAQASELAGLPIVPAPASEDAGNCVVFQYIAGSQMQTMAGDGLASEVAFRVMLRVCEPFTADWSVKANRIYTKLNKSTGGYIDGSVLQCWHEAPLFFRKRLPAGTWATYIGGVYRMVTTDKIKVAQGAPLP